MLQDSRDELRTRSMGIGLALSGTLLALTAPHSAASNWGTAYGRRAEDGRVHIALSEHQAYPSTAALRPVARRQVQAQPSISLLGERISALKDRLHASTVQMSKALGVSRQTLHAWQTGTKAPRPNNEQRIWKLEKATDRLCEALGPALPSALSYPIGSSGENFWDLLGMGDDADAVASTLEHLMATRNTRRKRLLSDLGHLASLDPLESDA